MLTEAPWSMNELRAAIRRAKTKRTGHDLGLVAELLKHAPEGYLEALLDVLFHALSTGQRSTVNGQPCMPHWAACFRHRGNLKQFHMYIIICRNVRIQQDLKTINPDPWQLLPTKVGPSGGKNFQGWCPKNFSAVQPFSAHKGSNAKPA